MENKKESNFKFNLMQLSAVYVPPTYKYNKKLNLIEWGPKNDYPDYLLNLYNNVGSTLSTAIINKKTKMISGKGFNEVLDPRLIQFITENDLAGETKKATLDYQIFNSFALEIIYSNGGNITSIKHIPIHKLRIGIEDGKLNFPHMWFSKDWSQYRKDEYAPEMIRTYNSNLKQGKQILFYTEYNPAQEGLYSIPEYSQAISLIELEHQISRFHLNQAKNGYQMSTHLHFSSGIPTLEEQDEFFGELENKFKGTDGQTLLVTYSDGIEGKAEYNSIQLSSTDERFIHLMDLLNEKIVQMHEIPPQIIIPTSSFSVPKDERTSLQEEFQTYYITPRQETIEAVLNKLLASDGYTEKLILKKYNQ